MLNVRAICFFIDKTKMTSESKRKFLGKVSRNASMIFLKIQTAPYLSECSMNFLYFSILRAFELILDKAE